MSKAAQKRNRICLSSLVIFVAIVNVLGLHALGNRKSTNNVKFIDNNMQLSMFWQNMINKHPTYVEAYIELAKIEDSAGNEELSQRLISKAAEIDPSNESVILSLPVLGVSQDR